MELKRLAKESERSKATEDDDSELECQMVDAVYLRSLPQHGAPVVLYPKEYLKEPSRYVEIEKQSGRDAQYASTFPHCSMKSSEYLWPKTKGNDIRDGNKKSVNS